MTKEQRIIVAAEKNPSMSAAELSDMLTKSGFATSKQDVYNAMYRAKKRAEKQPAKRVDKAKLIKPHATASIVPEPRVVKVSMDPKDLSTLKTAVFDLLAIVHAMESRNASV